MDPTSDFDHFLDNELIAFPSSFNEEEHIHTVPSHSVASHESLWRSPHSGSASETSDALSSEYVDSPQDVSYHMHTGPLTALGVSGQSFSFGPNDVTTLPTSAPAHFPSHHAMEHSSSMQGPMGFARPSIPMWRTASDGTMLSNSISSLALDNDNKLHHSAMFQLGKPVTIKCEQETDSMFFHHQPNAIPSLDQCATPMQASLSLPGGASIISPSSEKKRKLSCSEGRVSLFPGSTSATIATPSKLKFESAKKTNRRKSTSIPVKSVTVASQGAAVPPDALASAFAQTPPHQSTMQKLQKQPGQRRPPPSASQITEAGRPFPVIDTTAKHSSLFVPPDTSGLTKREARLVKNRAAAFLSRQRKREQFEELEIKCKAMSRMAWRMWEIIAGPDAPLHCLSSTVIPAVLADEDKMSMSCLEQIISNKGATIAPAADDTPLFPHCEFLGSEERSCSPAQPDLMSAKQESADASSLKAELSAANAEIEQLKQSLASAFGRENQLAQELNASRSIANNPISSVNTFPAPPPPTLSALNQPNAIWSSPSTSPLSTPFPSVAFPAQPAVIPFKADKAADLSLTFAPDPARSNVKQESSGLGPSNPGDSSLDFLKTPTFEKFSEAARRNKQRLTTDVQPDNWGLGLSYNETYEDGFELSVPSSPSSFSSTSSDSLGSNNVHGSNNILGGSRKAAGGMALMVILFGIALLGMPAGDLAKLRISQSSSSSDKSFSLGQVLAPVTSAKQYSLINAIQEEDEQHDESMEASDSLPTSHLSERDLSIGLDHDANLRDEEKVALAHFDVDELPGPFFETDPKSSELRVHAVKALRQIQGLIKLNSASNKDGKDVFLVYKGSNPSAGQQVKEAGDDHLTLFLPEKSSSFSHPNPSDEYLQLEFHLKGTSRKNGKQVADVISSVAIAAAAFFTATSLTNRKSSRQ